MEYWWGRNEWQVLRMYSPANRSHSVAMDGRRASKLAWDITRTFAWKTCQVVKSSGFKSANMVANPPESRILQTAAGWFWQGGPGLILPKDRCLDVTSTHKPTTRHSNSHGMPTKYFVQCDNFLLCHFDYVKFFYGDILTLTILYCDMPTQSWWIICPPQKMDSLSQCDILTHCNFGQPMAVTFCPLRILIFSVFCL